MWSTGSRHTAFSSCSAGLSSCIFWAPERKAQKLWYAGLVAPWHVGSSQIRDRTLVSCIGRQILQHWATRQAQNLYLLCSFRTFSFSNIVALSRSATSNSLRSHGLYNPPDSSVHGDSPGKNTGVGCHALLQGIFPNQGSNPGLPHCRWILYRLSHQGSPTVWI